MSSPYKYKIYVGVPRIVSTHAQQVFQNSSAWLGIAILTFMIIKKCTDCKIEKPVTDFYKSKTHLLGVMCYCKNCFNLRCIERWKQRKRDAIIYKGGKCERCLQKYPDLHYAAFEFHHVNPNEKDFDWRKLRLKPLKVIQKELDKCILVCANCHRTIHAELHEL